MKPQFSLLLTLMLTGCLPELSIPNLPSNPNDDYDGDGFTENQGDCDDLDVEITEVVWYADADDDDFGTGTGVVDCFAPTGGNWANLNGDCDDSAAAVHPNAEELCNGVDDNCKDGELNATDAPTWFSDGDDDGYGDADDKLVSCSQPSHYTSDGTDCDDAKAEVHPNADETCDATEDLNCDNSVGNADHDEDGSPACEDCDDNNAARSPLLDEVCDAANVDEDCDGNADNKDNDADGRVEWYVDTDGDNFGAGTSKTACDAPDTLSDWVTVPGDCDDAAANVYPEATGDECAGAPIDYDCSGDILALIDDDGDLFSVCEDCDDTDAAIGDGAYPDADGDGLGQWDAAPQDCAQIGVGGRVANARDCLDADESVGEILWKDADDDGYGLSTATTSDCALLDAGYASNTADCLDTNAAVHPGATDTCDDNIDQDCSGRADEACLPTLTHMGVINTTEIWAADSLHHVIGDVFVRDGGTLVIEDGAQVIFDTETRLQIGYNGTGALIADGADLGITFDSSKAVPARGDWEGLFFGPGSADSVVDGIAVRHAGSDPAGGAIWIELTAIDLQNVEVSDAKSDGIHILRSTVGIADSYVHDVSGDGVDYDTFSLIPTGAVATRYFTNTDISKADGYPLVLPHEAAGEIDGATCTFDSTLAAREFIVLRSTFGTVSSVQTWVAADRPYRSEGSIQVNGGALTLEDGVEIRMPTGSAFLVENAGLIVKGTTRGVKLTSQKTTPVAGDWGGLRFSFNSGPTTQVDGLEIAYAGQNVGNIRAALFVSEADLKFTRTNVHHSSTDGVMISRNGKIDMSNSTLADNAGFGLTDEWNGTTGLKTVGVNPSFKGNTLARNNVPLRIWSSSMGEVASDNVFTENASDWVEVRSEAISSAITVSPLTVPYHFSADVTFGTDVTVEPGVEFSFASTARLLLGSAASKWLVNGTASAPVVFTSDSAATPGAWPGIYVSFRDTGSVFDNAIVEYAGGASRPGAIEVEADNLTIRNSIITESGSRGIYVLGGDLHQLTLTDSEISENVGAGVQFVADIYGTSGAASIAGNDFVHNGGAAIQIPPRTVDNIATTNTFVGNGDGNRIRVVVPQNMDSRLRTIVDPGVPFVQDGFRITWYNSDVIVKPGVRWEFDGTNGAWYFWDTGSLDVQGTALDPVIFTSGKTTPAPGDWFGLAFTTALGADSRISNAIFEYGGKGPDASEAGMLHIDREGNIDVTDSIFRNSARWAMSSPGSSTYTTTNVTYANNALGNVQP